MIKMSPLRLNVFFHTDETAEFDKLDVDYDIDNCEVREMVFYDIAAISPYYGDKSDKNYTSIHSNATQFICPKAMSEVAALIYKNTI